MWYTDTVFIHHPNKKGESIHEKQKASRCRLLRLLSVLGLLSAAFLLCLLGSCRNAASDSDTETRSDAATGTATEPTTAATGSATDQNNTETDTAPEQTTAAGIVEPEIRLDTVTDVTLPDSSTEFFVDLAKRCWGSARAIPARAVPSALRRRDSRRFCTRITTSRMRILPYQRLLGRSKTVTWGGRERTVLLVSIRGTNAGEWYPTRIVPSRDPNTAFAENFYLAAQDIYEGLKSVLATVQIRSFWVSGSQPRRCVRQPAGRSAQRRPGHERRVRYTFASPNTVRKTPRRGLLQYFQHHQPLRPRDGHPDGFAGILPRGQGYHVAG